MLLYKSKGPVEPGPGDPPLPDRASLQSIGFVLHGQHAPYDKFKVYADSKGIIWAELYESAEQRLQELTSRLSEQ